MIAPRKEAYVPPGREPFLPFDCRSGWELLTHLEKYGLHVPGFEIMAEEDLIAQCLAFMKTPKFLQRCDL